MKQLSIMRNLDLADGNDGNYRQNNKVVRDVLKIPISLGDLLKQNRQILSIKLY